MIALIYFVLVGWLLVCLGLALSKIRRIDDKDFEELDKALHLRHFEDVNRKKAE